MTDPPWRRPVAAGLLAIGLLPAIAAVAAAPEEPTAGGTLAWFRGDDLDLLADMRAELPWRVAEGRSLFLSLDARTNIRQAASDLAFLVRDVDYIGEIGLRVRSGAASRRPTPFGWVVGQQGTQRVDADGQPWVRYLGFFVESAGFRGLDDGFQARWTAGVAVRDREVDVEGIARLQARYRPRRGPLRRLGFDARIEALPAAGELRADWRAGPSLWLRTGETRRLSLFARYVDANSPLGLGSSGWILGADLSESGSGGLPRFTPPDVSGTLGSGGGDDGRLAGVFGLTILSPPFGDDLRAVLDVEGNILTAEDTGEIYWLYHIGIERRRRDLIVGGWFYHRSNHELAEPNDRITFINVLEVGGETAGYARTGPRDRGVDGRLRGGYLINGSFGERRRWHVRGGVRWTPFPGRRWQPFLLAEAETGDVDRRLYALGLGVARDLELRLEYRDDEQFFGADRDAVLLMSRLGF